MKPRLLAAAALLAAGCAGLRAVEVAPDGRSARAGAATVRTQEGIVLFERDGELHVVSIGPGRSFDVAARPGQGGTIGWPADAPFEVVGGEIRLRRPPGPARIADLVASGQLYPHDDHFHLTRKYASADWQALYADREETSALAPMRRQVAAGVLTELLDERIPGIDDETTAASLARIESIIGKAHRAVSAGLPGRQIQSILAHDYEIADGGRGLEIEGRRFRAGEGVRFVYDGDHFHVESMGGEWVQPVRLEGQEPGHFEFPPSIFYEVREGAVLARPLSTRWQELAATRQIRFVRDHWHLTEAYAHPRLAALLEAMEDPALPVALRDGARGHALEVLRLRLDVGSEDEFEARLAAADRLIERHARAFERARRAAMKPSRR